MSNGFSVEFDQKELRKLERDMGDLKKNLPAVLTRSINRTAQSARTAISKEVAGVYRISSRNVLQAVSIEKANFNYLKATLHIKGYKLPEIKFYVSPNRPVHWNGKQGRKRPSPKVYKSSNLKGGILKPLSGNGKSSKAFIATVGNGHTGVFQRTGRGMKNNKGRQAIEEKYGPSIPEMVHNKKIIVSVSEKADEMLRKRVLHEMDRIIRRGI